MDIIGEAGLLIRAVDTGFATDVKAKVEKATLAAKGTVHISADTKSAEATITNLKSSLLTPLATKPTTTVLKAETKEAEAAVGRLGGTIGTFVTFAKSKLESFAGSGNVVSKALRDMEASGLASTAGLKVGLVGLGVAGAAAVAVLAVAGISKFQEMTSVVRGLRNTLGSTAEEASGFRNVAVSLGVDVGALGNGLFKMAKTLDTTGGTFAGVTVEIARNRDGNLNLIKTIDNMRATYQSLQDPGQKTQFLLEAFKKTGLELRPILSATNEEFDRMKKSGPIFHDKDLADARALSIAQRELGEAFAKLEIGLAKGIVPVLTSVAHGLTTVANVASSVHLPLPLFIELGLATFALSKALDFLSARFGVAALAAKADAAANLEVAASEVAVGAAATGAGVAAGGAAAGGGLLTRALGAVAGAGLVTVGALAALGIGTVLAVKDTVAYTQSLHGHQSEMDKFIAKKQAQLAATKADSASISVVADAYKAAAGGTETFTSASIRSTGALKDSQKAADDAAKAYEHLLGAQEKSIDATLGLQGALHAAIGSHREVEKATEELTTAYREHGQTSTEAKDAQYALEGAQISERQTLVALAKQMRDTADATKDAHGQTVSAEEATQLYKQSLLDVANTVEDPLKGQLIDLANKINDVPKGPQEQTTFSTNASDVAADILYLRDTVVSFPSGSGNVGIGFTAIGQADFGGARAAGGPVLAGRSYDVGEGGRERLTMFPGGGGFVTPLTTTAPMSNNASIVVYQTITQTFGPGASLADLPAFRTAATDIARHETTAALEGIMARRNAGSGTRG